MYPVIDKLRTVVCPLSSSFYTAVPVDGQKRGRVGFASREDGRDGRLHKGRGGEDLGRHIGKGWFDGVRHDVEDALHLGELVSVSPRKVDLGITEVCELAVFPADVTEEAEAILGARIFRARVHGVLCIRRPEGWNEVRRRGARVTGRLRVRCRRRALGHGWGRNVGSTFGHICKSCQGEGLVREFSHERQVNWVRRLDRRIVRLAAITDDGASGWVPVVQLKRHRWSVT